MFVIIKTPVFVISSAQSSVLCIILGSLTAYFGSCILKSHHYIFGIAHQTHC